MAESIMKRKRVRAGANTNGNDPMAQLMAQRAGMVQRGEYDPLGRLMKIQTVSGWIEFFRYGPTMGRLADGEIDLLDAWPELRPLQEATNELCPKCKHECDECDGSGMRACSFSCGGAGVVKTKEDPCPDCSAVTGVANPECETCRGKGALDVMDICPTCDGTGKIECPGCRGTGQMSTGYKDGALPTRNGARCPDCLGGFVARKTAQELAPHLVAAEGDKSNIYLGPITGFMLQPLGEGVEPQWWTVSADANGDFLFLVSRHGFAPGTRAMMLGGIKVPQTMDDSRRPGREVLTVEQ